MLKKFFTNHPQFAEIVRFVIVGGGATLVDMFAMGVVLYCFDPALYPNFFNVFYGGGEPSSMATVVGTGVGFLVGLLFNYLLSIFFVYQEKGNSRTVKGFVVFALLSLGGLLIHLLGMYVGFTLLGINEWIVKIVLTIVVLVYNYLTRKFFIFRKNTKELNEHEQ